MQIRKIDPGNRSDYAKFVKFPFDLYKNNSFWVPPLHSEMSLVFDRERHPFYRHSQADFFLAESDGQVLGRIAVLHNRHYCDFHNIQSAFFHYFEAIDDLQVAQKLFEVACAWAKRRGLVNLIGPKGFLRSQAGGILIQGHEYLPALGVPYNPPYYSSLLERLGFTKWLDQFSGYLDSSHQFDPRIYEAAEKVKKRGNFWVKTFNNKEEMRKAIPMIRKVQDDAFLDNPNYYPSTQEEFELISRNILQVAAPSHVKLIMKDEDVAGFIISYPDISKALQKTGGRLYPFGWITILNALRQSRVVNLNGVGLLPQYQGLGANILLYTELEKTLRKSRYEHAEMVQVNENNFKSKSDWDNMGIHIHKIHRIFQSPNIPMD